MTIRSIQSPSGAVVGDTQSGSARISASRTVTRWRTDPRGGTGFPVTIWLNGIETAAPDSGPTTQLSASQETQRAEDVGHRRTAGRTGLARQQSAYDDALSHDMGAQAVGASGSGHDGILGCQSKSFAFPIRRTR